MRGKGWPAPPIQEASLNGPFICTRCPKLGWGVPATGQNAMFPPSLISYKSLTLKQLFAGAAGSPAACSTSERGGFRLGMQVAATHGDRNSGKSIGPRNDATTNSHCG